MVAGITLEESISIFGHEAPSYLKDYKRVLAELNIEHGEKTSVDNRKKYAIPDKALVRMQIRGRKTGHLTVHYKGRFYDPADRIYDSKEEFINSYKESNKNWRIDWYMEIKT